MFDAHLQDIVQRSDAGLGAIIMDFEGIALAQYANPEARAIAARDAMDAKVPNLENFGMELSVLLKNLSETVRSMDAGAPQELCLEYAGFKTVVRYLSKEYFLAVALSSSANLGKARFLCRTRGFRIREEIES